MITDNGHYNSIADTFTPLEGAVLPGEYAQGVMAEVNNKFTFSAKILETDYYAKVLKGIKTTGETAAEIPAATP